MNSFTSITAEHIKTLNVKARKQLGQYMTPKSLSHRMAVLFTPSTEPMKVLDPAVGTGELLLAYKTIHPEQEVQYHGWDVDTEMLRITQHNLPETLIAPKSLFQPLLPDEKAQYDRIIANPPYFEVKRNQPELKNSNLATIQGKGRLNIYSLFFEYALSLLKVGGELVFLVPPSMNNGAYFKEIRTHILTHSMIEHIEIIRDNNLFADALTSVQIIKLVKTDPNYDGNLLRSRKWVVDFNSINPTRGVDLPVIFTDRADTIYKAWEGHTSLHHLGYKVTTGSYPWNQLKHQFTTEGIPLIYSQDITKNHTIQLNSKLAMRRWLPQGMLGEKSNPTIVVNRIIGSLKNPSLKHALVQLPAYYTENHVNVISAAPQTTTKVSLEQVSGALSQDGLTGYLQALTGNTQLSATELNHLIPLHL